MEIKTVKINSSKPYHMNCKIHTKQNIEAIKKSLIKFNQYAPLIVSCKTKQIIVGNGTFQALKELNYQQVDILQLDLTEEQEKILNISDNKTSELSFWNKNLLDSLKTFDDDFLKILDFDDVFLKRFKKIAKTENKEFDFQKNDVILNENQDKKISITKHQFVKCPCCGKEFLKQ